MRQLIESLKRLFDSAKIDKEKILAMYKDGKITDTEMNYIFGR